MDCFHACPVCKADWSHTTVNGTEALDPWRRICPSCIANGFVLQTAFKGIIDDNSGTRAEGWSCDSEEISETDVEQRKIRREACLGAVQEDFAQGQRQGWANSKYAVVTGDQEGIRTLRSLLALASFAE